MKWITEQAIAFGHKVCMVSTELGSNTPRVSYSKTSLKVRNVQLTLQERY